MTNSEAIQNSETASSGNLREKFRTLMATSAFFRSMIEGLAAGGVILLLMLVWMALRTEGTALKMQDYIPAKSASIEKGDVSEPAISTTMTQPEMQESAKRPGALAPVPLPGLTQEYDGKLLPISRIEDDMTPFQAYKKPFTLERSKAQVSIVLVDFGLSESLSKSALDNLDPNISVVLSPYSNNPAQWGQQARNYGHEFWLSLPMETADFTSNDTGPATLMAKGSSKENEMRLFKVMSSAVGYVGLVSQRNHVFTSDASGTSDPILKQIFGRGLAFAESNPDQAAYGLSMAMEFGYPYVQNNYWLDQSLRPDNVDRALQTLEQQALKKGKAIAFMHPYPMVINKVQAWIETAGDKGLQIAPLSATVQ